MDLQKRIRKRGRSDLSLGLPLRLPEPASSEAYKVVSIRLRTAEFEEFRQQAQSLGLTSNLALRVAARRIGGFLEIDQEVRRELERLSAAIGELSHDFRRLHADYVANGTADLDALAAERAVFGQQFTQLDALLRSILNVSQRRSDGRRKLAEAANPAETMM